jgi:hypothetical protein
MKPTDEYVVCSLEDAEAFAQKRNITVTMPESYWGVVSKAIDIACYESKTIKSNYVAEAPYQPGYEDAIVTEPDYENAVVTESKPFLYGIYKSKPLTDQEIDDISDGISNDIDTYAGRREFARAIEERHGIK